MNKRNSIILGVVLTLSTLLVVAQKKETREKLSDPKTGAPFEVALKS
jgi:hypothetical protein